MMSKGAVLIISGPSGCGKSTLTKSLIESIPNVYFSISTTTRPMREGETDGVHYHFVSKEHFLQDIHNNVFLEWAEVHTNFYGTSLKPVQQALEQDKIVLFDVDVQGHHSIKEYFGDFAKSVFITTTEMLSHAKGFLALNEKFDMPFDGTQVDIIVNAELPPTRKISDLSLRLLNKISEVIDGEVVFENDTFYIKKTNGNMVEFSLEAEGFRKFALIWKLLRNGLLSPGSILFWDEPEANINPELIPTLVEVLLELQRNGVQIFLATHSYNLARYFDVSRTAADLVQYVSLCREDTEIVPYTAEKYMDIPYNPIEFAGDKLFEAIVVKANADAIDGE